VLAEAVFEVSGYTGVILAVLQDDVKIPRRHRSRACLASLGINSHRLSTLEGDLGRPVRPT
jgi:hypothetical protein